MFVEPDTDILLINELLRRLTRLDPTHLQIREVHFFAGLTEPEIVKSLQVSERTGRRERRACRPGLCGYMGGNPKP